MEWMNFHNLNLYFCFRIINKQKQYFVFCWRSRYSWNCIWCFYNIFKKSTKSPNCKPRVTGFLKGWQLEIQNNLIQYFQHYINNSNIVLTCTAYNPHACLLLFIFPEKFIWHSIHFREEWLLWELWKSAINILQIELSLNKQIA